MPRKKSPVTPPGIDPGTLTTTAPQAHVILYIYIYICVCVCACVCVREGVCGGNVGLLLFVPSHCVTCNRKHTESVLSTSTKTLNGLQLPKQHTHKLKPNLGFYTHRLESLMFSLYFKSMHMQADDMSLSQ
jgi:hypothetical protein